MYMCKYMHIHTHTPTHTHTHTPTHARAHTKMCVLTCTNVTGDTQMSPPPRSLHWLLCRWRLHTLPPPQS